MRYLKQAICLCLFVLLAACGSAEKAGTPQNSNSSSNNGSAETPITPGNLPPPSAQSQAISQESFFQRKQTLDRFSSPLKKQIQGNYQQTQGKNSSGSSEKPVYNTLFGPVSVTGTQSFAKIESTETVNKLELTDSKGNTYRFAHHGATAPSTGACGTLATQFLCVTAPVEGQGFIQNTIRVLGSVNIAQVALFAYTDPVALISIFRQDGTPVSEFTVTASDLAISDTVTGPANARVREATFARDLQLGGAGQYTLVVSSMRDTPESVQLVSVARNIFYQDVPRIQLVSIEPPSEEPGNLAVDSARRHEPVQSGAEVSMKHAVIKVALTSQGTDNVGIVFENYDEHNNRRYVSTGDADFSDVEVPVGSGRTQTSRGKVAKLPLLDGFNLFKISVQNTLLQERGLAPSTPSRLPDITLRNTLPGNLAIQLRGNTPPLADRYLVEANSITPQEIELQFCVTRPPATDCLTTLTGDRLPTVNFNGMLVASDHLTMDSSGVFHARVTPQFGNNTYLISAKDFYTLNNPRPGVATQNIADFYVGRFSGSFAYGKLSKLYDSAGANPRYGFTERGVSLELARNVFAVELKRVLEKFLSNPSDPEFKQTIANAMRQDRPGPTIQCDSGAPIEGNSSIVIDPNQLNIGRIDVLKFETTRNNTLDLTVKINGLRARLTQTAVGSTGGPGSISVNLNLRELTVALSVLFQKENGVYKLKIAPQSGATRVVGMVGGAAYGQIIDPPSIPGFSGFQANFGSISGIIRDTFEKTIVCGLPGKMNFSQWITELRNLIDTPEKARAEARAAGRTQAEVDAIETNPFRLPLEFALFGRNLGLNVSYDLLRADNIAFDERGLHIWNMPVRLTPNNTVLEILNTLPEATKNILGTVTVPRLAGEPRPRVNITDDTRNLGLQISEDAVNQALSAANLGILSNVALEPNAFTNANGTYSFIYQAVPVVEDFLNRNVDLNQNGVADDARWPLKLALKPDVHFSPHFHYLNDAEMRELSGRLGTNDGESSHRRLNPNLKYFKLSIANLGLEFFRVDPTPNSYKTFCALKTPIKENEREYNLRALLPKTLLEGTDEDSARKRACQQSISVTFPSQQSFCPRDPAHPETALYNEFMVPTQNGPVISAVPGANPPRPVVAMQGDLTVYGVIQGVFRETLMADKYEIQVDEQGVPHQREKPEAKASNFVRIKLLAIPNFKPMALRVVENHTSLSEDSLVQTLQNVLVNAALNTDCDLFNEIQIPIPDRYPSLETQADCATLEAGQTPEGMTEADLESLRSTCDTVKQLQDFGIHHLDLGDDLNERNQELLERPELSADGMNPLYLDLRMHLGMCLAGELCAQ